MTLRLTGTPPSVVSDGLTDGRVPYSSGGKLVDSGNLTFDGTTLTVTGAVTASGLITGGTLAAGASTLASLGVTGAATVGTTLGVTGATTLAALSATTGSFSGTLGASGLLTVMADANGTHILGRGRIGSFVSGDTFALAHYDNATATNYALLQLATGQTILNTASGTSFDFRVNNVQSMFFNATTLSVASGVGVNINSTTASTSATTGALKVSGGVGVAGAVYAAGIVASSDSLRAFKNGSDSIGSGANFYCANVANDRAFIWQLSASNHADCWQFDGATWQQMLRIARTTTAGDTTLMLYDVTAGTLVRVTRGAVDSGGAGFRVLRIPN